MKIIDFEQKGNVVRFYLGDDGCMDYCGYYWDVIPYEHDAGIVFDQYVKGWVDISFDFDNMVLQPSMSVGHDSQFCKEDFKQRITPCLIVVPKAIHKGSRREYFDRWIGTEGILKFYYGDTIDPDKCPEGWNVVQKGDM